LGEMFRKESDNTGTLAHVLRTNRDQVVRLAAADPVALWEGAKSNMSDYNLVAKLYYYHQPLTSPLWPWLATNGDYILHLLRRNLFDAYISREIASRYNLWQIPNIDDISHLSFRITVNESDAALYIEQKLNEIRQIRSIFARKEKYFEIFFEDIIHTPIACAAAVEHIYEERSTFRSKYAGEFRNRRIKSAPNSTIVANYADVAHLDCTHVN